MPFSRCIFAFSLCCLTLPSASAPAGIVNTGLLRMGTYQQLGPTTFVPIGHGFEATALRA